MFFLEEIKIKALIFIWSGPSTCSELFKISPKSIRTQDFCDVKILLVIQAGAPPQTDIQYVR